MSAPLTPAGAAPATTGGADATAAATAVPDSHCPAVDAAPAADASCLPHVGSPDRHVDPAAQPPIAAAHDASDPAPAAATPAAAPAPAAAAPAPVAAAAGPAPAATAYPPRFWIAGAGPTAQESTQRIVGWLNRAVADDATQAGERIGLAVSGLYEHQVDAAAVVVQTCTHPKRDPPAKGVSAEVCRSMLRTVARHSQRTMPVMCWALRGKRVPHDVLRYLGLWIPNFRLHFFSMMEDMFDRGTEEQANRAAAMLASLCESGLYPVHSLVYRVHDVMCGPEEPEMECITRAACILQTSGKFLHDVCTADDADHHMAEQWHHMQRRLAVLLPRAKVGSRKAFMLDELQQMCDRGWANPKTLVKLHAQPVKLKPKPQQEAQQRGRRRRGNHG